MGSPKLSIRLYLAHPYGFSIELGRKLIINDYVFPQIGKIIDSLPKEIREKFDFTLIEPFHECGKALNLEFLETLELHVDHKAFWAHFCERVGVINFDDIDSADMVIAILDWHDSGVAAEVGYAARWENKPIVGLMTDFRPSENIATNVNCMITEAIRKSAGSYICGENCTERWFAAIKNHILEIAEKKLKNS